MDPEKLAAIRARLERKEGWNWRSDLTALLAAVDALTAERDALRAELARQTETSHVLGDALVILPTTPRQMVERLETAEAERDDNWREAELRGEVIVTLRAERDAARHELGWLRGQIRGWFNYGASWPDMRAAWAESRERLPLGEECEE